MKLNVMKKITGIVAGGMLAVTLCIPATALAADVPYPGAEDGTPITAGNTATTAVGLKADDSQLAFTAPGTINFAFKADGSFEYPTTAKFTNNSVFDLRVDKYVVTSDSAATGKKVADVGTATEANAYAVQVTPGSATTAQEFAVSTSSLPAADWNISHTSGSNTLGLTFSNGVIKNVEAIWSSGHNLQSVVWTVAAA